MTQPLVTFDLREHYLLVTGHGARNSLAEMVTTASLIFQKAEETNSRKMLVDYRLLDIKVNLNEAFNIVKAYERKIPGLRNIVVAAVFEPHHRPFAGYWQELSERRGFTIRVFEDFAEAERWLVLKQG
ncbi:MAG: hypothetical protein KIT62_07895 [Cyclobacteriaceae bacterium]|nr:hypothetical protein [Cyclobacteriaceae bacterium]